MAAEGQCQQAHPDTKNLSMEVGRKPGEEVFSKNVTRVHVMAYVQRNLSREATVARTHFDELNLYNLIEFLGDSPKQAPTISFLESAEKAVAISTLESSKEAVNISTLDSAEMAVTMSTLESSKEAVNISILESAEKAVTISTLDSSKEAVTISTLESAEKAVTISTSESSKEPDEQRLCRDTTKKREHKEKE